MFNENEKMFQVLDFVGKTLDERRAVLTSAVLPPGYNNTLKVSLS